MVLHLSELTKLSNCTTVAFDNAYGFTSFRINKALKPYIIWLGLPLCFTSFRINKALKPQIALRSSPSLYYIANIALILTVQLYINHHQLSSFFHLPYAVIVLVL